MSTPTVLSLLFSWVGRSAVLPNLWSSKSWAADLHWHFSFPFTNVLHAARSCFSCTTITFQWLVLDFTFPFLLRHFLSNFDCLCSCWHKRVCVCMCVFVGDNLIVLNLFCVHQQNVQIVWNIWVDATCEGHFDEWGERESIKRNERPPQHAYNYCVRVFTQLSFGRTQLFSTLFIMPPFYIRRRSKNS